MIGTKVWLNESGNAPADGLVWLWSFPGQDHYALRSTDGRWELTRGREDSAAVTVVATPERWATFLTSPRARRRLPTKDIGLEGSAPRWSDLRLRSTRSSRRHGRGVQVRMAPTGCRGRPAAAVSNRGCLCRGGRRRSLPPAPVPPRGPTPADSAAGAARRRGGDDHHKWALLAPWTNVSRAAAAPVIMVFP